jgi:quercetin dioxygenase-like cupin family protein
MELSVPSRVVLPQDYESVRYPDDEILLRNVEGSIQVVEYASTDREGPPAHRHPWHEVEYVIEGAVEFLVGDGPWTAVGPGGVQMLAAGVPHSVRVPGGTARLLMVTVGAPYDGFARAMAEVFARDSYSLPDVVAAAGEHGVGLG